MLSEYLAANMVALRRKRNLSQAALADLAGIPRSTITHMESGQGNPALQTLAKLAPALQVSIEELLSAPRSSCMLIKAADVPVAARGVNAGRLYKLLPDAIPGMEIDRLELRMGGKFAGVPHLENTKEYLTCVQGRVRIAVEGEAFEVGPGDVLAFPGDRKHSYQNIGDETAICISVVVLAKGL